MQVFDDDMTEYHSVADVQAKAPARLKRFLLSNPSIFPPESAVSRSMLRKCMRFFPQDMDTGGFFGATIDYSFFYLFVY